jgi:hypothetical protein
METRSKNSNARSVIRSHFKGRIRIHILYKKSSQIRKPAYDVDEPGETPLGNGEVDVRGASVAELLVRRGVRVEQLHEQLTGFVVLASPDDLKNKGEKIKRT